MRGVLPNSASALVQVCSSMVPPGPSPITGIAPCVTFGSGSPPATPQPDPEVPSFVLSKVDVVYQMQPLIPPFELLGIQLAVLPNMSIHRQVSMREMN